MHELSIADALVRQVEAVVAREGAARATSITAEVGALSGVDPDALSAAFPFVAETSPAVARATLIVVTLPGVALCGECGSQHEDLAVMVCRQCGSTKLLCKGGRDLILRSVELEFDSASDVP